MPRPCVSPCAVLLCVLAGSVSVAHANTAIGLYNPFNHGFVMRDGTVVNELSGNRVDLAHAHFAPQIGNLDDTAYTWFHPFYAFKPFGDGAYVGVHWQLANYDRYHRHYISPLTQSPYRNLHIVPLELSPTIGGSYGYFDPIERLSSFQGSPGFTANSGSSVFTSPQVDTGIGSAFGAISANGEMKLKVDITRSVLGQTPVAEGALQGTFVDTFSVRGPGTTAKSTVSFHLNADAPVMDFSKGDFYSYAVGYQAAIYSTRQADFGPILGNREVVDEYWSASDVYWMDARLERSNSAALVPDRVRIESIGRSPPDSDGVTESTSVLETVSGVPQFDEEGNFVGMSDAATFVKTTRLLDFDIANGLPVYDDPLMPFVSGTTSGELRLDPSTGLMVTVPDVYLPTDEELYLMVNVFVMAGCSDRGASACDFSLDASHTAGIGIRFDDPDVSMTSQSGFLYPAQAVPEPATWALLGGGLLLLANVAKRRRSPV